MEEPFTVKSSESLSCFPIHRRRPLQSRTLQTLIQILSHCGAESPKLHSQGDNCGPELTAASETNGLINKDVPKPMDGVVVGASNCTSVQAAVGSDITENICLEDGGVDCLQVTAPVSDHINLVTEGEQDVDQANDIDIGEMLVDAKETGESVIQIVKDQEHIKDALDLLMDEFDSIGRVEKEFSINDFSEVFESCFDVDMDVKSSIAGEEMRENGSTLEAKTMKEVNLQLQLKEMELEKLLSSSSAVDSSGCPTAYEEMEEGEISGEAGVGNESIDTLSGEAVSPCAETMRMVNENLDEEEDSLNYRENGTCDKNNGDPLIFNNEHSFLDMGDRTTTKKVQNSYSPNFVSNGYLETQGTDCKTIRLENQPPSGRIVQGKANEIQNSATSEKDGSHREKRKKGPLTKERRAKKKQKSRLKRAEKNRKLGVKRLKLQRVLKPKTTTYCNYYLQGRCREGEKCKFSHDTIPLTKSEPCCYFARKCCMKGDDCPFDHQLSKYPCNNYAATGFCDRGSDCLFSHKISRDPISSVTPTSSKPEFSVQHRMTTKEGSNSISKTNLQGSKFLTPLKDFNSVKQANGLQNVDGRFDPTKKPPGKSADQVAPNTDLRITGKAPKGVNFLFHGGMSAGGVCNNSLAGSSAKPGDGFLVREQILKVPGGCSKPNETSEGLAPRKPRGINFLSFAQPALDGTSDKSPSKLFANSTNEKEQTATDLLAVGKQSHSLPESRQAITKNKQADQSAKAGMQLPTQESTRTTPLRLLQHINSSYPGKFQVDATIFDKRTTFQLKDDERPLSLAPNRQNTVKSGSQDFTKKPSFSYGAIDQNMSSSFNNPFLLKTSSLVRNAVQSTLAVAEKFEHGIKVDSSKGNGTNTRGQ